MSEPGNGTAANGHAAWQPETDSDYGQALLRHFFWRQRYRLLAAAVGMGIVAVVVSLFMTSKYSTQATVLVDNKGASSASLATASVLLGLGSGDASLQNEIEAITSTSLAQQVIADLGLEADVFDPHSPDALLGRFRKLFGQDRGMTREDLYSRLTVSDVKVDPDRLDKKQVTLYTDRNGWRCLGQHGKSGEPCVTKSIQFTPTFGKAHHPGFSYDLVIRPERLALDKFKSRLTVATVNDNSTIISVNFVYHNPFLCKKVVDTIVDRYLQHYQSGLTGDYDALLAYVTDQTTKTKADLQRALDERKKYQEQSKVFVPNEQGTVIVQTISDLTQQQVQNTIQQKQTEFLLSLLDNRSPEEIASAIEAPGLQQLEGENGSFAAMVRKLDNERLTKTEEHPDIVNLKRSIKISLSQLRQSVQAHLRDLATKQAELQKEVDDYQATLGRLPSAVGKLAMLAGDIQSAGDILAMLKRTEADTRLQKQQTVREIHLLDSALLPGKRDSPKLAVNGVLGAILGLLGAIFAGLLGSGNQPRLNSLRELRSGLGLTILATLPRIKRLRGPWRPAELPDNAGALLGRLARLLAAEHEGEPGGAIVGVVHAADAGGFDLEWGLAAAAPQPALLVDGDVVEGALRQAVGAAPRAGLSELVAGKAQLDDTLTKLAGERLLVGPGAAQSAAPVELSGELLTQLRQRFAFVVVSLPPPSRWPAHFPLAEMPDALLLAVPQLGTDRTEVSGAVAELTRRGLALRGTVVTEFDAREESLGATELRFVTLH